MNKIEWEKLRARIDARQDQDLAEAIEWWETLDNSHQVKFIQALWNCKPFHLRVLDDPTLSTIIMLAAIGTREVIKLYNERRAGTGDE